MRSINLPCPRPPNRLAELWPRGALRSGPDCLWRTGRDTHLPLHAEMVRWEPDEGAVERDRVARIAHDRNGDKAKSPRGPTANDRGARCSRSTALLRDPKTAPSPHDCRMRPERSAGSSARHIHQSDNVGKASCKRYLA